VHHELSRLAGMSAAGACWRNPEQGLQGMGMTKRLLLAFVAYAAIALLTFKTLDDPRVRGVTLAILAMFAVKTWVRRKDMMHPDGESGSEQ
jgi:hypothetical protein